MKNILCFQVLGSFFLITKRRMQCSIPGSFRVLKQIGLALDFTKCASKCTWTYIFVVLYLALKEWVDK